MIDIYLCRPSTQTISSNLSNPPTNANLRLMVITMAYVLLSWSSLGWCEETGVPRCEERPEVFMSSKGQRAWYGQKNPGHHIPHLLFLNPRLWWADKRFSSTFRSEKAGTCRPSGVPTSSIATQLKSARAQSRARLGCWVGVACDRTWVRHRTNPS